jgi:hypothetical protein
MNVGLTRRLDRIVENVRKIKEARALAACICRDEGKKEPVTLWHTAEDLEAILSGLCNIEHSELPVASIVSPTGN